MEPDEIWRYVDAERASLADLLEGLSDTEWQTPSLCPGWTVREVAAHVISSAQVRPLATMAALARARGDFDRCIFAEARRWAEKPLDDIVDQYRRTAGSRRRPLGTTIADPLLDVLVHGQDIAMPLGRERVMPPEAARVAAERVWTKSFPFRARKRLRGLRLRADEVDWSVGEGALVEGPIEALLLLLTGRRVSLPRLSGAGLPVVRDRLSRSGESGWFGRAG